MNIAPKYLNTKTMIGFIIGCLIGCNVTHTAMAPAASPVLNRSSLPAPELKRDTTLHIKNANPSELEIIHRIEITPLFGVSPVQKDSMNLVWQRIAATAIQRSIQNRIGKEAETTKKDSVYDLLYKTNETINKINANTSTKQKIATATYNMFDYIITACAIATLFIVLVHFTIYLIRNRATKAV